MRSFIALSLLVACGGGHAPDVEALRKSRSLDCVIGKVQDDAFLISKIGGDGSPAALHALALGFVGHGKLPYAAQLANTLAEHGARDDARALLALPALTAIPDDADVEVGLMMREVRLRAGLPGQIGGHMRTAIEIRAEAEGGDVDGARKNLAQIDADSTTRFELPPYVSALTAAGRDDEARAALAAATDGRRPAAQQRLKAALITNHDIDRAVADLIDARASGDHDSEQIAVQELDDLARATGHAGALAPYRAAVAADLRDDPDLALALAETADATGDAGLRKLVDPVIDRIPLDDYRRKQLTAIDALYGDSLDAAMAAIENIGVDEPVLWVRLWLRHASSGLDPGFEARMIDACHAD